MSRSHSTLTSRHMHPRAVQTKPNQHPTPKPGIPARTSASRTTRGVFFAHVQLTRSNTYISGQLDANTGESVRCNMSCGIGGAGCTMDERWWRNLCWLSDTILSTDTILDTHCTISILISQRSCASWRLLILTWRMRRLTRVPRMSSPCCLSCKMQ